MTSSELDSEPPAVRAVGLDVGGTKILGVTVSGDGSVVAESRRPTVNRGEGLLDDLAEMYLELTAGERRGESVPPVGVGLPGLVDPSGFLAFSPNLREANETDVFSGLSERLWECQPLVQVDNDATCAAAGECAFGAARHSADVLFVTLGTGIGGGIVSGGRILRGNSNFAGEIGHVVVNPEGPPCGCGRRGCWERYASGSGLGRIARDHALAGQATRIVELAGGDPDRVRGEDVIGALAEGDKESAAILEEFAWWLALGLANLANVLDPRTIVIGGGLVLAGDLLLDPVRSAFTAQLEGANLRPAIEILPASLGERSGAIGAAAIALEAAGTPVIARPA